MKEEELTQAGMILALAFALAVVKAMVDTARELNHVRRGQHASSAPRTSDKREMQHDSR